MMGVLPLLFDQRGVLSVEVLFFQTDEVKNWSAIPLQHVYELGFLGSSIEYINYLKSHNTIY